MSDGKKPKRRKPKYTKQTLERAKQLRRGMTDAEEKLWRALRNRGLGGFKFRKQQPIGPFIPDFVCQNERLIVEADGSQHLDSKSDTRRDAYLRDKGYRILRFWNTDILLELEGVLTAIHHALTGPHPSAASRLPPSPSRGEGKMESD